MRSANRRELGPESGPVDLLGQLLAAEIDQAAVLNRAVFAVGECEPVDGAVLGVEDQRLVDVVGGVEGELLPGLIAGETICG